MSNYETNIGKVVKSTFAIGDRATAVGQPSGFDPDEVAETLGVLLGIVSRYTDPAAAEVRKLAIAAIRETAADKPERDLFQRLVDATKKMMNKLGSGVIEAAALADAVGKISEVIRHL